MRWYRTRKVKFKWEGTPALLGVATEVTDLINEQETNRQQRDLLESILKSVPIVIDCKDRDGKYTLANQAFLDFVGRTSLDEVAGKSVHDVLPKPEAEQIEQADRAVFAGRALDVPIEVVLPGGNGKPRVFRITKLPLQDGEGEIAGVLSVARDVTEDKARIKQTERERDQEKDRLQRIVDFADVGIFEADKDGITTWINPKGRELEELDDTEDVDHWREHLHETNRQYVEREWSKFLHRCQTHDGSDPDADIYQIDEVFKNRDGSPRILDVLVQATRSENRALTGFVGVFKDITDLKTTRYELQRSVESVSHNTKNAVCRTARCFGAAQSASRYRAESSLAACGRGDMPQDHRRPGEDCAESD